MSQSHRAGQVSSGTDREQFSPVGAPAPMTTEKLRACHDVHDDVDADQAAVYAVAHRRGVVQNLATQTEYEALNVLYLTADGEQACERWYARPDGFEAVDRAMVVDVAELEPAGEPAKRFAPIVTEHPEVGR